MCSDRSRGASGGLYSDQPQSEWANPLHLADRGALDSPPARESPPPRSTSRRRRRPSPDSSTGKRRRRRSSSPRRSRSKTRRRRSRSREGSRLRSGSRRRRRRSRSSSRCSRARHSSSGYKTRSSCSSPSSDAAESGSYRTRTERDRHVREGSPPECGEIEEISDGDEEEEGDVLPRQRMDYYCEVCDIYTNTFHELQTHFGGSKHNKNLRKIGYATAFKPRHEVRDPELHGKILRCLLCEVILTEAEVGYHVGSKSHATSLQQSEERFREMDPDKWFVEVTKFSEKTPAGYMCAVCEVTLPTFEGYKIHVRGKRHLKALKFSSGQDQTDLQSTPFPCQICSIFCPSQEALDTHLKGKRHHKALKHRGIVLSSDDKAKPAVNTVDSSPAVSVNPFVAPTTAPSKIRCVLCNVVLSNSTATQAHLTTTRHYIALRKSSLPPSKQFKEMFVPA